MYFPNGRLQGHLVNHRLWERSSHAIAERNVLTMLSDQIIDDLPLGTMSFVDDEHLEERHQLWVVL